MFTWFWWNSYLRAGIADALYILPPAPGARNKPLSNPAVLLQTDSEVLFAGLVLIHGCLRATWKMTAEDVNSQSIVTEARRMPAPSRIARRRGVSQMTCLSWIDHFPFYVLWMRLELPSYGTFGAGKWITCGSLRHRSNIRRQDLSWRKTASNKGEHIQCNGIPSCGRQSPIPSMRLTEGRLRYVACQQH